MQTSTRPARGRSRERASRQAPSAPAVRSGVSDLLPLSTRIAPELMREFKHAAIDAGVSQQEAVAAALQAWIRERRRSL